MKTNLQLSSNRAGRILLQLACISRHGRFKWHLQGIAREFGLSTIDGI